MLGNTALEINKNIAIKFKLNTQELTIWNNSHNFFYIKENFDILLKFLRNDSKYSLRVIDYFLTNYCYQKTVEYNNLNIFISYKNQLKKYHKKFFDPCSRGNRIPFFFNNDKCLLTTICQMNFFKWFIETNFYIYFENYYKDIKKTMKIKKTKKQIKSIPFSSSKTIYCGTANNLIALFD